MGALARQRALALRRLTAMFSPGAIVESRQLGQLGESLLIMWPEPRGPLSSVNDEPGFKQDCVACHCLSIIRFRRTAVSTAMIGIECPDHCLGRIAERSPSADLSIALDEAASAWLRLDLRQVIDVGRGTLVLPAGDGRFLSNVVMGRRKGGGLGMFGRPRTYVSSNQAWDGQVPLEPADDIERSVIFGGWALADKMPGLASPLTDGELAALEAEFEEATT